MTPPLFPRRGSWLAVTACIACTTVVFRAWLQHERVPQGIAVALACLAACALARELAKRAAAGRYRGRAYRVQLGLEFALFWWRELRAKAEQSLATLEHLGGAFFAARGQERIRIREVAREIAAGQDAINFRDVEEHLRQLVAQHAQDRRGRRHPRAKRFNYAPIVSDLIKAAVSICGWIILWRCYRDVLLVVSLGLVLLFAVHVLTEIAFHFYVAWHMDRAQAQFRTVFISAQPCSDELAQKAVESFAAIGHLVAVFVNDAGEPDLEASFHAMGPDVFFPTPAQTPTLIDTFIQHADLLVIQDDPNIARLCPSASVLPADRRWFLAKEDNTPAGFRYWYPPSLNQYSLLEALSPRSTRPLATSGLSGAAFGWSTYGDFFHGALLLPALWLLGVPGFRAVGTLLTVASAGWLFPRILGPLRRRSVSSTILRVPRNATVSRLLSHDRLAGSSLMVAFVIACQYVANAALGDGFASLALHSGLCAVGGWGVLGGVTRAIKWSLDWNFRVVVLRRNSQATAWSHRNLLTPVFGAYGQIVLLQDPSLASSKMQGLNFLHRVILSDAHQPLQAWDLFHGWKSQIVSEIQHADFAVFDWQREVTENMIWEMHVALSYLPPSRILVVCERPEVKALLAAIGAKHGAQGLRMLNAPYSLRNDYGSLRREVYEIMAGLQVSERPASSEESWTSMSESSAAE